MNRHERWYGMVLAGVLLGACLLLPARAAAQGPGAPWRTLETASFRVHYPHPYEAWTLRLASRLEAMRARLARDIGYTPPAIVDVVVMDPASTPNGMAVPLLGSPRLVLWTTPPAADSVIGHYHDWGALLAAHEDAHLVQLLRPSRNPAVHLVERLLLPIGPIARHAPRWVTEGYATLLEGQLTGAGRPHGDMRAAILRRWAQQGRLPSYERLSSDRDRWMGMSMAYLAGSAYLEWLVARTGPESLRHLWARLTARTVRSFDEAFRGVFGDAPAALYGRFSAELAREALALEQLVEPVRQDGVLWQRFEWSTGAPAVSPDGSRIAIVLAERDRPARLAVFDTGPDEDGPRRRRERLDRMLALDPDDVPPVSVAPPAREPLHVLHTANGAEPIWPRWMPDGESLLFVQREPDSEGFLHPDLFQWRPETAGVTRLTRGADLHRPDPAPDGRWAAAVRHREGFSQLVRVDLETGDVGPLTPPSVEVVYDSPRVSPDGRWIAYLRNDGAGWRVVVRGLADDTERVLPAPPGATVAGVAWSPDGASLYLSVGEEGFIDIQAWPALEAGPARVLTRTHGAALAAAPVAGADPSDSGLFFLSLESHGLDLRFIERVTDVAPLPELPAAAVATRRLEPEALPELRSDPVTPGRRYRAPQELVPIAGGSVAESARVLEVGVRGGDLIGRLDYLAIASLTRQRRGPRGAAFAAAWRGWPITVGVHLFGAQEALSRQPLFPEMHDDEALDVTRRGAEVDVRWERLWSATRLHAGGGALVGQAEAEGHARSVQRIAFVRGGYLARPSRDRWHARHGVDLRLDGASTGGAPWQRLALTVEGGGGYGRHGIVASAERRLVRGSPAPFDRLQLGGLPGSILPAAVLAGRPAAPGVPVGALVGDEYRMIRLAWTRPGPSVFYERHEMRDRGQPWGDPLSWLGTEVRVSSVPMPLLMLPAAEVRVGVSRLFGRPEGGRLRWWAGLRWSP